MTGANRLVNKMKKQSALHQVYSNIINTLMGAKGQQNVVSPLPPESTLTEALASYLKIQQQNDANAKAYLASGQGQASASGTPIPYPSSIANGPSDRQKRAVQIIRNANPDLKMSDADIIAKYNQYGDRLLQGLPGGPTMPAQASNRTPMTSTTPTPVQAVLGAQAPTQRPNQPINNFEQRVLPTFNQHGISPAVAFGIAGAEGGNIGNNNIYNMGAVDSNPGAAFHYDSPEAAATSAARLMQTMIQKRGASGKNPLIQLKAIQDAGYAGDPQTWRQRSASTGGAGQTFGSWSDFVKSTPAWKKWYGN